MAVAVVKYKAGNIHSVVHALRRLGVEPIVTDSAGELKKAEKVVFPGQGEAIHVMNYLREHGLDNVIRSLCQPVLGICIGQQLLCRHTMEGDVDCIGIFPVVVEQFVPLCHEDKVPHMGWNDISDLRSPLMEGVKDHSYVYFVHSYFVPTCQWTIATTNYVIPFSAAMNRDNFYATQFHPEKSGSVGETILKNFLLL